MSTPSPGLHSLVVTAVGMVTRRGGGGTDLCLLQQSCSYFSDLKYAATSFTWGSVNPAMGFILPLPFFTVEVIWSTVRAFMSGSETGLMPIAFAIPGFGVPVAPWHIAHLDL